MTKNLLVELGLEEIPAYIVTPAMHQLRDRMATFLTDNRLQKTLRKFFLFVNQRK